MEETINVLKKIADYINTIAGGRMYYVGGYVR